VPAIGNKGGWLEQSNAAAHLTPPTSITDGCTPATGDWHATAVEWGRSNSPDLISAVVCVALVAVRRLLRRQSGSLDCLRILSWKTLCLFTLEMDGCRCASLANETRWRLFKSHADRGAPDLGGPVAVSTPSHRNLVLALTLRWIAFCSPKSENDHCSGL